MLGGDDAVLSIDGVELTSADDDIPSRLQALGHTVDPDHGGWRIDGTVTFAPRPVDATVRVDLR